MGLPKADFLINGMQKADARLHDLLKLLSNELQAVKNAIGTGVNSTTAPVTIDKGNRQTFQEVAQGSVGKQSTLKVGEQGNVEGSGISGRAGASANSLKRISVRM